MIAHLPQPEFETLYHRAFADFSLRALWNVRELEHPTAEEALAVTRRLRIEGDLNARRLAEQIEQACRAALQTHLVLWVTATLQRAPGSSARAAR
jgi:hypothetical protein